MAQALYCSREEVFTAGLGRDALSGEPSEMLDKAIAMASAYMDSKLGQRYVLPFVHINDPSMAAMCAQIAAYYALRGIGFNPEGGTDQLIVMGWKDANKWLDDVVAHRASPQVTDSTPQASPGNSTSGRPRVLSGSGRGYSDRQTPNGRGWFRGD